MEILSRLNGRNLYGACYIFLGYHKNRIKGKGGICSIHSSKSKLKLHLLSAKCKWILSFAANQELINSYPGI